MSLTARGPAYRGTVARCPACGEPMRVEMTSIAEIDACDACGGLWIDWFDGELGTIAAEAEALRVDRGTPLPPSSPLSLAPSCPRCSQALGIELHRFHDAKDDELITGVELFRCADCAGAFVPRGSAQLLLERVVEGPPMSIGEVIAELVRRLFRGR